MYLTYVGSGPSSVLVVIQELLGFAFEFGKGPSGKRPSGLQEPQCVSSGCAMHLLLGLET